MYRCPVCAAALTSDAHSFRCRSGHVFDIARGIRETLLDLDFRGGLIRKGFEQMKRLSWADTAARVLETYEEVGAGPPYR